MGNCHSSLSKKDELQALREEQTEASALLKARDEVIKTLRNEIHKATEENSSLQAELKAAKGEHAEELQQAQAEVKEIKQALDESKEAAAAQKLAVAAVQDERDRLQSELVRFQGDMRAVSEERTGMEAVIDRLKLRVAEVEQSADSRVRNANESRKQLEAEKERLKLDLEQTRISLQNASAEASRQQQCAEELEAQLTEQDAEAENQIDYWHKLSDEAEKDNADQYNEVDRLTTLNEEICTQRDRLEDETQHLTTALEGATNKLFAMKEASEEELAQVAKAKKALEAKVDKLEKDACFLNDELLEAEKKRLAEIEALKRSHGQTLVSEMLNANRKITEAEQRATEKIASVEARAANELARVRILTPALAMSDTASNIDFSRPVKFSRSGKDLRVEVSEFKGEMRVDLREWYSGVRSTKGVSMPIADAKELAKILPSAIAKTADVRQRW